MVNILPHIIILWALSLCLFLIYLLLLYKSPRNLVAKVTTIYLPLILKFGQGSYLFPVIGWGHSCSAFAWALNYLTEAEIFSMF